MMPPAIPRVRVGKSSPRYTANAGYETPRHKPPAIATSHIAAPDVANDDASKIAPNGTMVAPNTRRPLSSATRPPRTRPIDAGEEVATVNNATSVAEYPRVSFR